MFVGMKFQRTYVMYSCNATFPSVKVFICWYALHLARCIPPGASAACLPWSWLAQDALNFVLEVLKNIDNFPMSRKMSIHLQTSASIVPRPSPPMFGSTSSKKVWKHYWFGAEWRANGRTCPITLPSIDQYCMKIRMPTYSSPCTYGLALKFAHEKDLRFAVQGDS